MTKRIYATVSTVIPRGSNAIVVLDEPYVDEDGKIFKYGIIREDTIGRIKVMTESPNGKILEGLRVSAEVGSVGIDAIVLTNLTSEQSVYDLWLSQSTDKEFIAKKKRQRKSRRKKRFLFNLASVLDQWQSFFSVQKK